MPPVLTFLACIAILFESTRILSGRFGDVLYFFVWAFLLSLPAINSDNHTPTYWTGFLDTYGFGFLLNQMHAISHTASLSIGSSEFDGSKAPYVLTGIPLTANALWARLVSLLYPLLLILPLYGSFTGLIPIVSSHDSKQSRKIF